MKKLIILIMVCSLGFSSISACGNKGILRIAIAALRDMAATLEDTEREIGSTECMECCRLIDSFNEILKESCHTCRVYATRKCRGPLKKIYAYFGIV
jgi:predicted small lipoprotein YifL